MTESRLPLIVLAGHGSLPSALLETAQMIAGDVGDTVAVGLDPGERPEVLASRVGDVLDHAGNGRACLLLVDLFGGSPATACAQLIERYHDLEIVTGLSLPMLLEAVLGRDGTSAADLAALSAEAGHTGVVNVRERLQAQATTD